VEEINFTVDQGADFRRIIRLKDEQRQPINIIGRTYYGAVKQNFRSTKNLFEISLTVSDETLTGEIHLHITADHTRNLRISDPTEFFYDIKQFKSSEETIILAGKIIVIPRATK
jgi:hypothetical protein